jgi:hypothetical protein
MGVLNRLRTKIARVADPMECMDDPIGDYMFSLEKRIDKLESNLGHLEKQLRPQKRTPNESNSSAPARV